jgi:hypothetical protein
MIYDLRFTIHALRADGERAGNYDAPGRDGSLDRAEIIRRLEKRHCA